MTNKNFAVLFVCIGLTTYLADGPNMVIGGMFMLAAISFFVKYEKAPQ